MQTRLQASQPARKMQQKDMRSTVSYSLLLFTRHSAANPSCSAPEGGAQAAPGNVRAPRAAAPLGHAHPESPRAPLEPKGTLKKTKMSPRVNHTTKAQNTKAKATSRQTQKTKKKTTKKQKKANGKAKDNRRSNIPKQNDDPRRQPEG